MVATPPSSRWWRLIHTIIQSVVHKTALFSKKKALKQWYHKTYSRNIHMNTHRPTSRPQSLFYILSACILIMHIPGFPSSLRYFVTVIASASLIFLTYQVFSNKTTTSKSESSTISSTPIVPVSNSVPKNTRVQSEIVTAEVEIESENRTENETEIEAEVVTEAEIEPNQTENKNV